MARTCPKKNIVFCIAVLVALNLGIVLVVAQMPIPFLSFEEIAQRVNLQVKPDPVMAMYQDDNRLQSCTGTGMNCHANTRQVNTRQAGL